MGHSGSKMKKFRQSLRRLSFSRSMENLKRKESKMRHSRSLTNLTVKKKEEIVGDKKARRNTVVITTNEPVTDSGRQNDEKSENSIGMKIEETAPLTPPVEDCKGVKALKEIVVKLSEMENQIDQMTPEDLFVYHSTFKDEIHNFWIKAYEIKEANDRVKPKKNETIDYVKKLLHKLNNKMFRRNTVSNC